MNKVVGYIAVFSMATVAVLLAGAKEAEAVTCNVLELSPCLPAFTSSSPPSSPCCEKLKEQTHCLCQYAKDPNYGQYVDSPQAKKVASTCQVTVQC